MTIGIESYTYRGYDLVHFTKTGVTLVHAYDTRKILHQARSLEDACHWVDRHVRGGFQTIVFDEGGAHDVGDVAPEALGDFLKPIIGD